MARERQATNWDEVPVLFDVPYAARLLRVSADVLSRKCKSGEFPAHKVFNQWRIRKDELIAFIQNN